MFKDKMPNAIPSTVVHIPHASMIIPATVLTAYAVSQNTLAAELLRMTDHFTDELFQLPSEAATSVVFPVSRLVVDPERFVDDTQEPMSGKGMGVVYTKTSDGQSLRPSGFSNLQRMELLEAYYYPHHRRLSEAVSTAIGRHGNCLIIDGHSFSSRPLQHEFDQHPHRPDICIGTDDFHTPPWLSDLAVTVFKKQGLHVEINRPFAGTIVPEPHFQRNPQVRSIMIEINRSVYMCEATGSKLPAFTEVAAATKSALMQLISQTTE